MLYLGHLEIGQERVGCPDWSTLLFDPGHARGFLLDAGMHLETGDRGHKSDEVDRVINGSRPRGPFSGLVMETPRKR